MGSNIAAPRPIVGKTVLGSTILLLLAVVALALPKFFPTVYGSHSIDDRLRQYGPSAAARLSPKFAAAGVSYPPARVTLVGLKRERELRVYAADAGGPLKHIVAFPIRGASGGLGPKLREGDRQVPEGVYPVESLNPNSRFHLSLRVGYPNDFDRARAREEGRTALGGDIMIHGGSASVGCLAVGDEAAEDLFVLAAACGVQNLRVVLAPCDLRSSHAPIEGLPSWVAGLYESLRQELGPLIDSNGTAR
jgi:hypothetical protein